MGEWESDDDRPLQDPWESDDDIPLVLPRNEDKLAEVNSVFYSMFIDSASSAKSDKKITYKWIYCKHTKKNLTKRMINKKWK